MVDEFALVSQYEVFLGMRPDSEVREDTCRSLDELFRSRRETHTLSNKREKILGYIIVDFDREEVRYTGA